MELWITVDCVGLDKMNNVMFDYELLHDKLHIWHILLMAYFTFIIFLADGKKYIAVFLGLIYYPWVDTNIKDETNLKIDFAYMKERRSQSYTSFLFENGKRMCLFGIS